ncbi:MAG: S53 family peptidase [Gemmatimonadota bacterium]|nr:S53 family peptidase [Gemmatimonadota bacterium]
MRPETDRDLGSLDPSTPIEATIVLRPLSDARLAARVDDVALLHPARRTPMSSSDASEIGDPGDTAIRRIRELAERHGVEVVDVSRSRHDVVVRGTAERLSAMFRVELREFHDGKRRYRAHDGPLLIHEDAAPHVLGVVGLDTVPIHHRVAAPHGGGVRLSPAELLEHYRFPDVDTSSHRIAVLQFGGGFHRSDLDAFASRFDVELPEINVVSVPGSSGDPPANAPLAPDRLKAIAEKWRDGVTMKELGRLYGTDMVTFMSTMEVTMDIELVSALGGGATIDVLFAPPGADGWRRAIYRALGEPQAPDEGASEPLPTVISASWGASERSLGANQLSLIHRALVAALRRGVAVCCSSGDFGANNSFENPEQLNVNFPASSPATLACGGSRIVSPDEATEAAWSGDHGGAHMATGGGMSGYFRRPVWQTGLDRDPLAGTWVAPERGDGFGGRWLPDVAAVAALDAGPEIVVGDTVLSGGGTSAATPLWACLLLRLAAVCGHPMSDLAPWLYDRGTSCALRDVVSGDGNLENGAPFYRAGPAWDPCTGWGTPDGQALVDALRSSRAAADNTA